MDYLPLFLALRNTDCLVVGGGEVAVRKIRLLLQAGAQIRVVAPRIDNALKEWADNGDISLHLKAFAASDIAAAQLIIAATNDRNINSDIAAAASARHRLCNVVDDRELSTAIMPGIVDRSPVIIAVSTCGTSPVLATQLRQRIDASLPANFGKLAGWADSWRAKVREHISDSKQRLQFWQTTLDSDIATQVLSGNQHSADEKVQQKLAGIETTKGIAWLVGAGPGDPELLTLKALRRIQTADVIVHDRLVAPQILTHARKDADKISVGKQNGVEGITQTEINSLLVKLVRQGKRVCRLKGGDPFIFGRGGEELAALNAAGIDCEVVPGITAAAGCAAAAGIPLTHRNVARSVTFVTGQTSAGQEPDWQQLVHKDQTLVMYMSLRQLETTCRQLIAAGRTADCPVVLIENGTTSQQRSFSSTLAELAADTSAHKVQSPALLIIGDVAALSNVQDVPLAVSNQAGEQPWLPVANSPTNLSL
jgi:uroporphyrin-III C-methyltransferase/precorrin-2 dehydrogenase/sirohydrochlorin ferrochelatase